MMRSILIAAVVGVLVAVPTSYFLTATAWQDRAATGNAVSETVTPAEAWPICSTMGSMVETADWAALDPDFAAGKRAHSRPRGFAMTAMPISRTISVTPIAVSGSSTRQSSTISRLWR